MEYPRAEALQLELTDRRLRDEIPDTLILLEHPPVITSGRQESAADLLLSREALAEKGIEFYQTDRGGKLTYHGPGQLVGYFIFKLGNRTIPEFVAMIENLLIDTLRQFEITAGTDPEHPGVWVGRKKIAALGLHFEKGISRHGFALNVDCDLTPYSYFTPCGISDRGVTSMKEILGNSSLSQVKERMSGILLQRGF